MGLGLEVGVIANLHALGEADACSPWEEEFSRINEILRRKGLPEHHEPTDLKGASGWSCDMIGYSGLHRLRRVAAHIWARKQLPVPGGDRPAHDPLVKKYHRAAGGGLLQRLFECFGGAHRSTTNFDHLMLHCDAQGYYLPNDFPEVLFVPEDISIPGVTIGSSIRLANECRILANSLEIPNGLDFESDEVCDAIENGPHGEVRWKQYAVETYTCLALLRACDTSVSLQAAIVFT